MNADMSRRVSRDAFEARYAKKADPWDFEASAYEQGRYRCILRSLSKSAYDVGYEPGCSIGVLTARLAGLCKQVIASDIASSAVRRAKARCAGFENVTIRCEDVATYVPEPPLDLIVFSEIGYYFEPPELSRIVSTLAARLQIAGEFVAVHWLGRSKDHVLHGDEVHRVLKSSLPLHGLKSEFYEHFRIDSWVKT